MPCTRATAQLPSDTTARLWLINDCILSSAYIHTYICVCVMCLINNSDSISWPPMTTEADGFRSEDKLACPQVQIMQSPLFFSEYVHHCWVLFMILNENMCWSD